MTRFLYLSKLPQVHQCTSYLLPKHLNLSTVFTYEILKVQNFSLFFSPKFHGDVVNEM